MDNKNFFDREEKSEISYVEKENGTVDRFVFVSKDPNKGISVEEAKELQAEIMKTNLETTSFSKKVNNAAKLFTNGAFQEAVEVYSDLAEKHPEERGLCEGQIGAAKYFMEDYHGAIEHYKKAIEYGDTEMQEENIFEAAEEYYKETEDASLFDDYLETFPDGKYREDVRLILTD